MGENFGLHVFVGRGKSPQRDGDADGAHSHLSNFEATEEGNLAQQQSWRSQSVNYGVNQQMLARQPDGIAAADKPRKLPP